MGTEMIIVVAVIAVVLLLSVIFSMWKKVPQDKAAVVTGLRKKVITGGGGLVIPVLERIDYISLGNIQLDVRTEESMSSQGVPIGVVGTAVIKVKNEQSCIFKAIEQFTGKNEQQIEASIRDTAMNVLEGKLREIVSTMTVEDIYRDRETFSSRVQEVVGTELTEMGLEVKVFTIKDINDRNGYIEALGVKQIADKKKDAEIAKAEAARETQIQTSKARQAGEAARLQAETEIAEAQKAKMVQEAVYRQENETAKAKADAAYEIQKNITQKEVTAAEMDAELLKQERQKDIEAAQVQIQIVKEQKEIELAQKRAEKTKVGITVLDKSGNPIPKVTIDLAIGDTPCQQITSENGRAEFPYDVFTNGEIPVNLTVKGKGQIKSKLNYTSDITEYTIQLQDKKAGGEGKGFNWKWLALIPLLLLLGFGGYKLYQSYPWGTPTVKEMETGVVLVQSRCSYYVETGLTMSNGKPQCFYFAYDESERKFSNGTFDESERPIQIGTGTGFLISKDGLIATNRHIADPIPPEEASKLVKQLILSEKEGYETLNDSLNDVLRSIGPLRMMHEQYQAMYEQTFKQ